MGNAEPSRRRTNSRARATEFMNPFELLKTVAAGIQESIGDICEVVLHDLKDLDHSIVWIRGNVTGRHVRGSLSEIGLEMIRDGETIRIIYVRSAKDGKVIKSTSIILRDHNSNAFGALGVNIDVTSLLAAKDSLARLVGEHDEIKEVLFSDQVSEVLRSIFTSVERELGYPSPTMSAEARARFIRVLDAKGAFTIQRSVPTVGKYFGVSRATIYKELRRIRNGSTKPDSASTKYSG